MDKDLENLLGQGFGQASWTRIWPSFLDKGLDKLLAHLGQGFGQASWTRTWTRIWTSFLDEDLDKDLDHSNVSVNSKFELTETSEIAAVNCELTEARVNRVLYIYTKKSSSN